MRFNTDTNPEGSTWLDKNHLALDRLRMAREELNWLAKRFASVYQREMAGEIAGIAQLVDEAHELLNDSTGQKLSEDLSNSSRMSASLFEACLAGAFSNIQPSASNEE